MNQYIQKQIEEFESKFMDRGNYVYQIEIKDFLKTSLEKVWEDAEVNMISLLRDAIEETYGLELTSRIFRTLNEKVKEAESLKQTT